MIGYYVHIPFCLHKCSYCDFTSYAGHEERIESYVSSLLCEIISYPPQKVDSIFFGGGTPSLLSVEQYKRILKVIADHNEVSIDAEISTEMNPDTVTDELARSLLAMGFNRFSMGLQSSDNAVLKEIGRTHNYERFQRAYASLRNAGAKNINIDIMYGLPGQSFFSFQQTIEEVMKLNPEHVSAYELNVNENTPIAKAIAQGRVVLPDEKTLTSMVNILLTLENKFPRYEISNYSKKGFECRHNLNYWRNGQYIGIGCGAHGCLESGEQIFRYSNKEGLEDYIQDPLQKRTEEVIAKEDQMFESVMVGLRLVEGIDMEEFYDRYEVRLDKLIGEYVIENPMLIEQDGNRIRLTRRGMDIQNTVLIELMEKMYDF